MEQGLHQVTQTWSPYSRAPRGVRTFARRLWQMFGFNHGTASLVRYEADMLLLRTRCALSRRYRRSVRQLAGRRGLLVHLGCGNALFTGWLNLDCYPPTPRSGAEILTLDMRRGLPLATGSVAAVFTEHFLEHLPLEIVRDTILPEIRRVLQPGGHLRLSVPDGEYFIDQYLAWRAGKRDPLFDRHRNGKTPMTMLNEIAHGYGHYFAYDFETLAGLLREAGFGDIRHSAAGQSEVLHFAGRDRTDEWRTAMSLYIEAQA